MNAHGPCFLTSYLTCDNSQISRSIEICRIKRCTRAGNACPDIHQGATVKFLGGAVLALAWVARCDGRCTSAVPVWRLKAGASTDGIRARRFAARMRHSGRRRRGQRCRTARQSVASACDADRSPQWSSLSRHLTTATCTYAWAQMLKNLVGSCRPRIVRG